MNQYVVKSGDSLSRIAKAHWGYIAGSTLNAKVNTLVDINGIRNRNLIYPGQVIYFSRNAGGGTGSSSPAVKNNKVTIDKLNLKAESTTGRDVFAYWSWTAKNTNLDISKTKNYKVRWEYDAYGQTRSQESETEDTWATYSIPEEAQKVCNWVQVFVTPIAEDKTVKEGDKETTVPCWVANEHSAKYDFSNNPPFTPNAPTCEITDLTLTMKIDEIKTELNASHIIFQVIKDNMTAVYTSGKIPVTAVTSDYGKVSHTCAVVNGSNYKVRAKAVASNKKESGWSEFSDEAGTKPSAPAGITTYECVKRSDDTLAARLSWAAVSNATKYKIEYATVKSDFENKGETYNDVTTEDARTTFEISGLEEGKTYFFRVRAVNDKLDDTNNQVSVPSETVEIPIGRPPAAPSIYTSSRSAFLDELMELNWIHNASDNSKQTYAQLSFNITYRDDDPGEWITPDAVKNETDENSIDAVETPCTYGALGTLGTFVSYKGDLYFKMNTTNLVYKNAKVQWKARTAGVTTTFSDTAWSFEDTIYIYEKPALNLTVTKDLAGVGGIVTTLDSFPFYIRGSVDLYSHDIQRPVGYHLRIVSNDYYATIDDVGQNKIINPGDEVYSKYFSTSEALVVEMSADNLDLESSINYTVYIAADMSTGLSIENQHEFTVDWTDTVYALGADISVDTEAYTALITPHCHERVPAGPGGKNLITYPYYTPSRTVNGLTFTDNGDGTITVNGTATAKTIHYFQADKTSTIYLEEGVEYTLSGTPGSGSIDTYCIQGANVTNSTYSTDYGTGKTFVGTNEYYYFYIAVREGVTLDNAVFKPQLELGSESTEYEEYYEAYEEGDLIENVTLAVYRREYDGTYKEIASGVPNDYTSVTDPHPSLDYARYRLVAKDTLTGAISFYDMAGYPVNAPGVVLQWDEEWSTFDSGNVTSVEAPAWSGSLLKLPYNIKVSDNRKRDVTLVGYAGREHPVSYYGTKIDESPTWNVDIPKEDKETIYALRRLSLWTGDVYVRESSGTGYWANVNVSFNQDYSSVIVPVTLNITRVEGGV